MTKQRKKEWRSYGFKIETLDVASDGTEGVFEGIASAFNNRIELPWFDEIVVKGAFKKTLRDNGPNFPILKNHDPDAEIGIGLQAKERDDGLWVKGELHIGKIQAADETWAIVKRKFELGSKHGISIGFTTISDRIETKKGKKDTRYLEEINLMEYSLTPFPANTGAKVTNVRSYIDRFNSFDERERALIAAELGLTVKDIAAARMDNEPEQLHSFLQSLSNIKIPGWN